MSRDDYKRAVKDRASIVDVVGEIVKLKRSGDRYSGVCPFHNDSKPSFYVSESYGTYHCFGCGAKGDAISFIMQLKRVDFVDALDILAERYGIRRDDYIEESEGVSRTQAIRDALDFAAKFYRKSLLSDGAERWRDYLAGRSILHPHNGMCERFVLGCARPDTDIVKAALSCGIDADAAVDAGVFVKHEADGSIIARCSDGITMPIYDKRGGVVAISYRNLAEYGPKYIHTHRSPLFSKADTFFGLYQAIKAVENNGSIVLTEGAFDTIAYHSAGDERAVAVMGSNLSRGQTTMASRWVPILSFDSDKAGIKATADAAKSFLAAGVRVMVCDCHPYGDPDEAIKAGSDCTMKPKTIWEYVCDVCERCMGKFDGGAVSGKAWERVKQFVDSCSNPFDRNEGISYLSERLRVSRSDLMSLGLSGARASVRVGAPSVLSGADKHLAGACGALIDMSRSGVRMGMTDARAAIAGIDSRFRPLAMWLIDTYVSGGAIDDYPEYLAPEYAEVVSYVSGNVSGDMCANAGDDSIDRFFDCVQNLCELTP